MTRNSLIALAIVVPGAVATWFFLQPDYVQTSCDIDENHGVAIWMGQSSEIGKRTGNDIEFQINGVVVNLSPIFHFEDWKDVELVMEYSNNESNHGVLRLRHPQAPFWERTETIGTIQRSCWEAVKKYLGAQVRKKGIVVHVSEKLM